MTKPTTGRGPGRPPGSKNKPKTAGLVVQARYDAGGNGKRLRGWQAPTAGPNRALQGLEKMRDRQRDARRNDWSADSGIQKWATALIGTGIVPRFKRVTSASRRQVITDLFDDWTHECDADYVSTYYGMQTLAALAWFDGGECFLRYRYRSVDFDLSVPLQIQLLEADQLPNFDADTYEGLPLNNYIRSGIEFNKYGRRIAYWFYKHHPGDAPPGGIPNVGELVRVQASSVEHIFEPKRPGQIRGVPLQSSVLLKLRDIGDYEDAVLIRQKLANLFMAFLKEQPQSQTFATNIDPLTLQPVGNTGIPDADDSESFGLEPGLTQKLPRGYEMQFANPPEAGTTYSDYLRTSLLGVAAGTGMPYELLSGDIKDISDRAMRVVINEFRRFAESRQWQTVIPRIGRGVVREFALQAALIGKITIDEIDLVRRPEWAPHGWAHIHPVQDPQGRKIELDMGSRSRSSVIAERGDDPDQVDQERKLDRDREKKLGLYVEPKQAAGSEGQQQTQEEDQ